MHERKIAYRPAFLRDVKRLKNKHYNMNTRQMSGKVTESTWLPHG